MKLISEVLQEKGLKQNELPEQIKHEIEELRVMIVKYNEACDEYDEEDEKDTETEQELDAMEDSIAEFEQGIASDIRGLQNKVAQQSAAQQKSADGTKPEEKKGSSLGWLLFGGVALALTLGAVNVFKKK
jgi:thiol:disulfide interchange protein